MATARHLGARIADIDATTKERMASAYTGGVPIKQMQERFGISGPTIVRAMKDANVPLRGTFKIGPRDLDDQIIDMRRRGMSCAAIGAMIQQSASYVHGRLDALRKAGALAETLFDAAAGAPRPMLPAVETPPPRKCQWPLWGHHDRPSHCYCNEAVTPGKPYCADHAARAYTTTPADRPYVTRPPNKSQPKAPSLPADDLAAKKAGRGRRKVHADRQPAPLECCITDTEREIAADWNSGLTASEIATRQQKAEGTIAALISRIRARNPNAGPKRRGNPMFGSGEARQPIPIPFAASAQLAAILRHYNDGKTYQAIADAVGLNKGQVAGLINRARPRSSDQAAA